MSKSEDYFHRNMAQTTPFPIGIEIEYARGSWLYGPENRRWLDMISGVAVANIGHNHPHVISAIKNQVDKHLHVMVYGEYIQEVSSNLAKKLADILPLQLNTSYFVNSGTEDV